MANIIVMPPGGRVEQLGAPLALFEDPVDMVVAGFIGSPAMNFIDATIVEAPGGGRAARASALL